MKKSKMKALLLSMAVACACGVLGVSTLFASAMGSVDVATTDLFTADSGITAANGGLTVNTKVSTATMNGTLSGDFSVEYVYTSADYGESEFTFYDKDDLTKKVFSVYRSFSVDQDSGCACVIDYRGSATAEKILYLGTKTWENKLSDIIASNITV